MLSGEFCTMARYRFSEKASRSWIRLFSYRSFFCSSARRTVFSRSYRCVEAHFDQLEAVRDDRYPGTYGFWRPYALDVIFRYLDCGDLHFGFARVKCKGCGHEYLLAFSCKRRHLGLWEIRNPDPPSTEGPRSLEFTHDDDCSQVAPFDYYPQ